MDFDCDDDVDFLKVIEELDNQEVDSTMEPEPRTDHFQCLQNIFGHTEFRPCQWKVIRSIIEDKRDNCCVMATGYGKSLCFQFPPVFLNGISFIISPLISLMQDQVNSLNLMNIRACMLGSAQTNKSIENDIVNGDYRIVYASPEYMSGWGSSLIGKLKDKLTLIAVDEAHCISSWGQDFRPKFLELKNIRNEAPNVPILAVTATATDRVQKDICTILKLKNPQIICTGFDRPNLEILVKRKTKDSWDDIGHILRSKLLAEASCIVYCLTRKITDNICDELKLRGLKCGAYHAGKTPNQRKEVFDKFIRDEINVIVATVAFGMGIDKSDVRCVIHYGAPADMDSYYQEIGRAGRDGVQSKCILFYSEVDFEVHRHLRMKSRLSDAQIRRAEERSAVMSDFIFTKQCRRLKILQYFDGPTAKCEKPTVCCDNCRIALTSSNTENIADSNKEVDFSKDAKILLDAIRLFDGFSGVTKPIALIRGSRSKSIERYHNNKLMGTGKHRSEQYWKTFADFLERNELLQRQFSKGNSFGFYVIKLTRQGQEWLVSNKPLQLVPSEQLLQLMTSENNVSTAKPLYDTSFASVPHGTLSVYQSANSGDEELKRNLMMVRAMIASREGTMPYKIASEPAIDHLVRMKPLNLQELRDAKVDGFSEALLKQFGSEFLKCIQRSKGLLPQKSVDNLDGKQLSSNMSNDQVNHTPITTISSNQLDNIVPIQSDNQNMFEDEDDELFMNVDCEHLEGASNAQKPAESQVLHKPAESQFTAQKPTQSKVQVKAVRISTTVSKRVKYENSSSSSDDEDNSKMDNSNPVQSSRPQASVQKPPVGIRKRNIF